MKWDISQNISSTHHGQLPKYLILKNCSGKWSSTYCLRLLKGSVHPKFIFQHWVDDISSSPQWWWLGMGDIGSVHFPKNTWKLGAFGDISAKCIEMNDQGKVKSFFNSLRGFKVELNSKTEDLLFYRKHLEIFVAVLRKMYFFSGMLPEK